MRLRSRLVALAAAFVPLVMLGTPSGAVVFEGDTTLPVFPCTPNCGATGTPNEAAPLVFISDIAAGAVVMATRAGAGVVTSVTARLKYSEPPCIAGEAVTGTATGTMTFNGTNAVGTVLPFTFGFQWQRVGLVAVITGSVVAGAAVLVPTSGLPNCTGGPAAFMVAGSICVHTPEGTVCIYP